MLDIKIIRETPELLDKALKDRQSPKETLEVVERIKQADGEWRKVKYEEDKLRAERNALSMEINAAVKAKKDAKALIAKSQKVSARIKEIAAETEDLEKRIKDLMLHLPNLPDKSVPVGKGEADNPEARKHGKIAKHARDVADHHDLGERSGLIDFERGVKLACHRFSVLRGPVAKLERALVHFMLSVQAKRGYTEYAPPYMVNTKTITGTGQLPKFSHQQYKVEGEDLWLIPTAEVPLTNLFAGEALDAAKLPLKVAAYSPCFRREAGEYGRDIRGLIRQHQFDKVELVKFTRQEDSFRELEGMVKDAEEVLRILELPYRVVELCTGDLGFAAAKTYDLEVWMPSQDRYREISSCSNCTDFQARRADIRYRDDDGKMRFVHTLNGSGLAVGRTLIAILENFQEGRKTVAIPEPLRDFMGMETIEF